MTGPAAPLAFVPPGPPLLQVIVDTEEEFDWHKPFSRDSRAVTAIGAAPLGQALFDRYGLRPTYVIDHPVATTPDSIRVLRTIQDAGRCQIGAHLHPWVNPPFDEMVTARNSYPGNLPPALERHKLEILTDAIEKGFAARPTVYKAGRYGIGPGTTDTLQALGYRTDASVLPHTDLGGDGGPDFRGAPDRPSWTDHPDGLLELPLTRGFAGRLAAYGPRLFPALERPLARKLRAGGILARLGLLQRATLTPEGNDAPTMRRLFDAMLAQGHRVFTLSFHSPSLAPGHTPYVRTPSDLDAFLRSIETVLDHAFTRHGAQPTTAEDLRHLCT